MSEKRQAGGRRRLWLAGIVVLALVVAGAYVLWSNTGGSGEASAPVSAPQLAAASATVYRIVAEESEVRFRIDEVLNGADFTVVGVTDQVAGDIRFNSADPAATELGTLRINVRTLQTDSGNRDRAIRQFILNSSRDEYEFAEFTPAELGNLPASVTPGEPFALQITGTLNLAGASNELTFAASVTLEDETRLSGSASATAPYADLGIDIPRLPAIVASVAEEVTLEIEFVALAVEEDG